LLTSIRLALLTLVLCSCASLFGSRDPATPTPAILADTFFTACAYLDANHNDQIDSDDPALKGARFVVALSEGFQFGATTLAYGCGTVVVPGGLSEQSWPVTVRMEPPEGSGYQLVSPAEVVLQYPKGHANFLFAPAP
jgi:hypothetical protein